MSGLAWGCVHGVHETAEANRPPCTADALVVHSDDVGICDDDGGYDVEVVDIWTGQQANALRAALRMTNEAFAQHLGTAVRTVAKWNAQPDVVPVSELQRALDTALSRASAEERARFAILASPPQGITEDIAPRGMADSHGIDQRLSCDPAVGDALHWLDSHGGWPPGEARRRVRATFRELNEDSLQRLVRARHGIGQAQTADALRAYYEASAASPYRFYSARCNGVRRTTSVLTKGQWLNLGLALGQGRDRWSLDTADIAMPSELRIDNAACDAAVTRLAETLSLDTRFVNAPLYRLMTIDLTPGRIVGAFGITNFVEYALTLDLMENELVDAMTRGLTPTHGALPLRDRHVPDLAALTDLTHRICVGGPVTLTAIARSHGRRRGIGPDYVLLVQERSSRVLNAARRLAVIPKAFHQPLVDPSEDADLLATIEREMEEELLGRLELDGDQAQRSADPMHVTRLSEPMRWLIDHSDTEPWRTECTAFGINAMSGNFEFASLVVVNDDRWWDLYGGVIEANWEAEGLRRYSTQDSGSLAALINDPAWSNEGLFALLEGLRRLRQLDNDRIAPLPSIEVES